MYLQYYDSMQAALQEGCSDLHSHQVGIRSPISLLESLTFDHSIPGAHLNLHKVKLSFPPFLCVYRNTLV